MARKKNSTKPPIADPLSLFRRSPPLGGFTAENEPSLGDYYSSRENYLDKIQKNIPGLFVLVGEKGSGKSAILRMMEGERHQCDARTISIRPSDLSIWSIAKFPELLSDVYRDVEPRFLNKTLWNFLFVTELLRKEHGDEAHTLEKIATLFRGSASDPARIRRLIGKGLSLGTNTSMSARFMDIIEEIKLSIKVPGGVASLEAKLVPKTAATNASNILHDLTAITTNLGDHLKKNYLILLDDLDQDWSESEQHVALLEGLFGSMLHLQRTHRVSFVAGLREDIYRRLKPEDGDKIRQGIKHVGWEKKDIEQMILARIKWSTGGNPIDIWQSLVDERVRISELWHASGFNPRRALTMLETMIENGKRRSCQRIDLEIFNEALHSASIGFLTDVATLHRNGYPGLDEISRSIRVVISSEFDFDGMETICADVAGRWDKDKSLRQCGWVREHVDNPLDFARVLLETGVLLYKLGRDARPERYSPRIMLIDDQCWYAVNPSYERAIFGRS